VGEEVTVDAGLLARFPRVAPWLEAMLRRPTETIRPDDDELDTPSPEEGADSEVLGLLRDTHATARRHYELGERLGVGGMGVVRGARQVVLAREVAVKTLREDMRDPLHAARLLREAWVVGALEHPNIVPIHDLRLDDDGFPLLVQKRIDGVAWSKLLADPDAHAEARRGEDPLVWNLRVLVEVCRALRFAHRRGIVHRDVKPQNVMLGELGEVYLVDWGVAVSLRADDAGLLPMAREARAMAGTPAYMAPEMLGGSEGHRISVRTDVYLLGATLCELVCGSPPHRRSSVDEMIGAILASEPKLPANVPGELGRLIREAMAREPDARIRNVGQFQERIEDFLRHRASAQLAADSASRLVELEAALARRDRTAIYKQYGAVRFGCLESSRGWPEGTLARETLLKAVRSLVAFEIAEGDAIAAQRVLADFDDPPAALLAEVESALAEDGLRRASIERLREEHDLAGAAKARRTFGLVLGAVWAAVPVVGIVRIQILGHPQRPWEAIVIPSVALASTVLLGLALRHELRRTGPNRRLFAAILFAFAAQLLLNVGLLALGLGPPEAQLLVHVPLALVAAFFAISVHRRFAVAVATYVAGYLVCLVWRDARLLSIAIGNLVLMERILRLPGGSGEGGRER